MDLRKALRSLASCFQEPEYERKRKEAFKYFETLNMGKKGRKS